MTIPVSVRTRFPRTAREAFQSRGNPILVPRHSSFRGTFEDSRDFGDSRNRRDFGDPWWSKVVWFLRNVF